MSNRNFKSDYHLYQPVSYRAFDGSWHSTFLSAALHSGPNLTVDPAAILSLVSFGYICGDRTLVNEVKRRSWLSSLDEANNPVLLPIPEHHRYLQRPAVVATTLEKLLCEEVINACIGKDELYILLSGGLDSRVTAGVVHKLLKQGKLNVKPVCVTWGIPNCRDVIYAKEIAKILEFDWIHVNLDAYDLRNNIKTCAEILGATISPVHLHQMGWFKNVRSNALVLASSYGDMVGRAEFSGSNILELNLLEPKNSYNLLQSDVYDLALDGLNSDLEELRQRLPFVPKYVVCEHEMHAHYTRGLLAHAMSVINQYCSVYHVFTAPKVYQYMWSIHPSFRTDKIYKILLNKLHPGFSTIPWARTNRSLDGSKARGSSDLYPFFHKPFEWISSTLYDDLTKIVTNEWVKETGLFQLEQVNRIQREVKEGKEFVNQINPSEIYAWLGSFKLFNDFCEENSLRINYIIKEKKIEKEYLSPNVSINNQMWIFVSKILEKVKGLRRLLKHLRRLFLRLFALIRYPPEKNIKSKLLT